MQKTDRIVCINLNTGQLIYLFMMLLFLIQTKLCSLSRENIESKLVSIVDFSSSSKQKNYAQFRFRKRR